MADPPLEPLDINALEMPWMAEPEPRRSGEPVKSYKSKEAGSKTTDRKSPIVFSGETTGHTKTIPSKEGMKSREKPRASGEHWSEFDPSDRALLPLRDDASRTAFKSRIQFYCTILGYSIGLGNIWQFPIYVYKNGGGTFIIQYIVCLIFFGIPSLYMEMVIGQLTQTGLSNAYMMYVPIMQGIGWASAATSFSISVYYNILNSWSLIYFIKTLTYMNVWKTCGADPSMYCISTYDDAMNCNLQKNEKDSTCLRKGSVCVLYQGNGTCMEESERNKIIGVEHLEGPADQYFNNLMMLTCKDGNTLDTHNFTVSVSLCFMWILTAILLVKGIKLVGRLSLIAVTVPFIMLASLLIYAIIALDHIGDGLKFFFVPDFDRFPLFGEGSMSTWQNAMSQVCFSTTLGIGGMVTLTSYNKRTNDIFRDAFIYASVDFCFSLFSGMVIFSFLGHLGGLYKRPVNEIINEPFKLLHVVVPQALSDAPLSSFWCAVFFAMVLMLGLTTMIMLVELPLSSLVDLFPICKKHRIRTLLLICFAGFCFGIPFCSGNGFKMFTLVERLVESAAVAWILILEFITIYIYGPRLFYRDIKAMLGRTMNTWGNLFGPYGMYIRYTQFVIAPVFAICLIEWDDGDLGGDYKKGPMNETEHNHTHPFDVDNCTATRADYKNHRLSEWVIGQLIAYAPLVLVPLAAVIQIVKNVRSGKSWKDLFLPHPTHPSLKNSIAPPTGNAIGFLGWKPIGVKHEVPVVKSTEPVEIPIIKSTEPIKQ